MFGVYRYFRPRGSYVARFYACRREAGFSARVRETGKRRLDRGGAGRGGDDRDRSLGMFVRSEPAARGRRGVAAEDRRLVGGGSVALRRLDLFAGRGLSRGDLY